MPASIQPIKNKFRVTFEHGKDANGKRERSTKTVKTEKEAIKLKTEFEYNEQRSLLANRNKMTVVEALEYWLDNYVKHNCEKTTVSGYRNVIYNHLIPALGSKQVQELQPSEIQQYYTMLQDVKNLSPNTVHRHHAVIRKMLDFALKQQLVYRNVADAVSLPKKRKSIGQAYTKDQLKLLFDKVKDTKLELPVLLASYLGLRRSEIMGLKWDCVDFEKRVIRIVSVRVTVGKETFDKVPKTDNSNRVLHMADELYNLLMKHYKHQIGQKETLGTYYDYTGYVVVRENGKPARVNTVTEQFKEFLEKQELPHIRLHDLRHTFASVLYNAGLDLKAISEALGHSEIGTTSRIYTHIFDKTHKKALEAMSMVMN
ncbi:tyrosine recombinase XerC [Paenibacillus sp. FSL R7-269]|uniref:site-specific integrase n=1 Tax=Paenibacillus sp. FSL R7-269 TaxID=1226755 RepID=UPI0003E205E5|nr:tyrosine-type recombinase/integrase [Paenibacillus sp. FSL R7-269]ETT56801.1 tyrosine recombinase XerC [Paenibacillus sp. FSL R7-269]